MTYKPDLNDPRVRRRMQIAVAFAISTFGTKPKECSAKQMRKHLGNRELGNWIRNELFTIFDHYYNPERKICKTYQLNATQANWLYEVGFNDFTLSFEEYKSAYPELYFECWATNNPLPDRYYGSNACFGFSHMPIEFTRKLLFKKLPGHRGNKFNTPKQKIAGILAIEYYNELQSHTYNYKDKSDRLFHPLQYIKSDYRTALFKEHGYSYNYDLVCAAPSLLSQRAIQIAKQQQVANVINSKRKQAGRPRRAQTIPQLRAVDIYLRKRTLVRKHIANLLEIDDKTAKQLFNSMFAGAIITPRPGSDIFEMLDRSSIRIDRLRTNRFIQLLKEDIAWIWNQLGTDIQRGVVFTKTGVKRKTRLTSKIKWNYYFKLERSVLDVVRGEMKKQKTQVFLEHDGWRTTERLDKEQLRDVIRQKTGLVVAIDEEIIE